MTKEATGASKARMADEIAKAMNAEIYMHDGDQLVLHKPGTGNKCINLANYETAEDACSALAYVGMHRG